MDVSKFCIYVGGALSLCMVLFHSRFYKLFDWKKEFENVSLKNRRIFYTIHMALLLLFLIFAFLSFVFVNELSQPTGIALGVTLAYSVFWLWRTIWQKTFCSRTRRAMSWPYCEPKSKIRMRSVLVISLRAPSTAWSPPRQRP